MKTGDLIHALAADARPLEPARVARRFYLKLAAGAALALLGVLVLLGVRPDLGQAWQLPMFWLKLLFPASLALAALVGLHRLGHPGMRLGRVPAAVALPPVIVWLVAGAVLLGAPAGGMVVRDTSAAHSRDDVYATGARWEVSSLPMITFESHRYTRYGISRPIERRTTST